MPLVCPRGDLLWGHYRLKDVYLGIPIAMAAFCSALVLLAPARIRRALALRSVTLSIFMATTFLICDVAYAFGVMRAWRGNLWFDQLEISRRYSVAGQPGFRLVLPRPLVPLRRLSTL